MTVSASRGRLGLLAIAFDGAGRELLAALAERPEVLPARVCCCHALPPSAADGKTAWFCCTRGAPWSAAGWDPQVAEIGPGIEAAVCHILDAERWQAQESGFDLLDLVLVSPGPEPAAGRLPAKVPAALLKLRRRFRRIGRILLFVDGRFETAGEAAARGRLRPLPLANGTGDRHFDLAVLCDRINMEGLVINSDADARAHAAGVLAHLTVGQISPLLYGRIQAEKARLGEAGRFVGLGFAEWPLTAERSVEAIAAELYRLMAGRLVAGDAAGAAGAAGGGAASEPPDLWVEQVAAPQILHDPRSGGGGAAAAAEEDLPALANRIEAAAYEDLQQEDRGLGDLEARLLRRIAALKRIEARATLGLATFMDRAFARWYVDHRLGRLARGGTARVETLTVPRAGGKLLCAALAGLCLGCVGGAVGTTSTVLFSVLAAGFGLGAVLVLVAGSTRQVTITMPAPPSAPDLTPELRFRRGRNWLARELVQRHEKTLAGWRRNRDRLRADCARPQAPASFPFTPEVCAALLAERSISAAECLRRFLEHTALPAAIFEGDGALPEELRRFARSCCDELRTLDWSAVFRVMGGEPGLADPTWRGALEKARNDALPWLPVSGASPLQTVLALPRSLPAELRDALGRHFPDQKAVEVIDGDAILVLQLTQGYEMPER